MFAPSAKGFHIDPPAIPDGTSPADWFRRLFIDEPDNFALLADDREQWDMKFFIQGVAEMILIDERDGMERRTMRFLIHGDDMPGPNNVGVIIPTGRCHALRTGSSSDLVMIYGTSTVFEPASEGRIAASVELAPLPEAWRGSPGVSESILDGVPRILRSDYPVSRDSTDDEPTWPDDGNDEDDQRGYPHEVVLRVLGQPPSRSRGTIRGSRRKDEFGAWLNRLDYGNRHSSFGWEIAGSPTSSSTGLASLRPMHWQNYLDQVAAGTRIRITADGLRNTRQLI